jgi:rRNA-processing protein FCF1|tara:strand:- start:1867 stop:2232 length:366 start_codon:yes stop_codon:yes gene_type:complete
MEVLLDSSFIISCIRKRIDFLDQLKEQGFKPIVPREVLQEMKDLYKNKKSSQDDRIAINVANEMVQTRKVKKMKLGGKNVDEGLIEKGNEGYFIATLDRAIKHSIPNKIVINSSKGRVERG